MAAYHIKYGYLKVVRLPDEIIAVPAFKEEQMKLTKEEVEFLLDQLKEYRMSSNK